ALLGAAASFPFPAALSPGQPLVGALIFPVGLVMIVLLGLELVTGSFALLPLARLAHGIDTRRIVANWGWVFLGNLIGSVIYGGLLAIALTNIGTLAPAGRPGPHPLHSGSRNPRVRGRRPPRRGTAVGTGR